MLIFAFESHNLKASLMTLFRSYVDLADISLLLAAAWVHRGFSDDVTELRTVQPGGDLLTDFQKDKFRYFFFHVLDLNSDNVISSEDFDRLNEVKSNLSMTSH